MWHVSVAPLPGLFLDDATLRAIAIDTLKGVGKLTHGQWEERGERALHIRRRLSVEEEAMTGPACDIRRTDDGERRLRDALRWLHPNMHAFAAAESAGLA